MKASLSLLTSILLVAACGGGSSGTTGSSGSGSSSGSACTTTTCNGTCCAAGDSCISNACCPAAQACGATCCSTGAECVKDMAGNQTCGVVCQTSSACTAAATPCCEPVSTQLSDGGLAFSGSGVCAANPTTANPYACLCTASTECGSSNQCVPDVNSAGIITGPYICAPDTGAAYSGCQGALTVCTVANQFCSTDKEANEFCSIACTTDALCGNTGVACCNTTCGGNANSCCGLCGH